jgi:hypothetical protein
MRRLSWLSMVLGSAALAGPLKLHVVDGASRQPMPGVKVDIGLTTAVTDAAGDVSFSQDVEELDDGAYLTIDHPEYLRVDQRIWRARRPPTLTIVLTRNRDFSRDLSLRGFATSEDGGALPGRTAREVALVNARCGVTERQVSVQPDGSFLLEHLAPGPCSVTFFGGWRGVTDTQKVVLTSQTPPLSIGPRLGAVRVSVLVRGETTGTEVFLFAGDTSRPPRQCSAYNGGTGGAAIIVGFPGHFCPKREGRYVCEDVPVGNYTVTVRTTLPGTTAMFWLYNEWSARAHVGTSDVLLSISALAPAVRPEGIAAPQADGGGSGRQIGELLPLYRSSCSPL